MALIAPHQLSDYDRAERRRYPAIHGEAPANSSRRPAEVLDQMFCELRSFPDGSRFKELEQAFGHLGQQLAAIQFLRDGWDSYGAPAPSISAMEHAAAFLQKLRDRRFLPDAVIPSAEGGIAFYFEKGQRTAYFEYRNSGEAIAAMYAPFGEPEIRELDFDGDNSESIEAARSYLG